MTGYAAKPDFMPQEMYDKITKLPHKQLTRDERSLRNALTITVPGPVLKPWEEGREL